MTEDGNYLCITCKDGVGRTLAAQFRHSEATHPETLQKVEATDEQKQRLATGQAELAALRKSLGR